MIRFLCRFLGLVLLAAAFIAVVIDGMKSIAANQLRFTSFGQYWTDIHATSLQFLEGIMVRHLFKWLWNPAMMEVLARPAWLVLGILGVILLVLGRKKKPLIGYARD